MAHKKKQKRQCSLLDLPNDTILDIILLLDFISLLHFLSTCKRLFQFREKTKLESCREFLKYVSTHRWEQANKEAIRMQDRELMQVYRKVRDRWSDKKRSEYFHEAARMGDLKSISAISCLPYSTFTFYLNKTWGISSFWRIVVLFVRIYQWDTEEVVSLLEQGQFPLEELDWGLGFATLKQNKKLRKMFLLKGASYKRALFLAAEQGHNTMVKLLFKDSNTKSQLVNTCLLKSISLANLELIEFFISQDGANKEQALILVIEQRMKLEFAKPFLQAINWGKFLSLVASHSEPFRLLDFAMEHGNLRLSYEISRIHEHPKVVEVLHAFQKSRMNRKEIPTKKKKL